MDSSALLLKLNFSDSLGSKMPSASSVLMQGKKKRERVREVLETHLINTGGDGSKILFP